MEAFLLGLELIDQFLELLGVKSLIVLTLRGELVVFRLLLAINVLLRDLELVPILGMTPVDPPGVLEPLPGPHKDSLELGLDLVNDSVLSVEDLIQARLRLRDLLLTPLSTFPHDHLLEVLDDLLDAVGEEAAI